MNSYLKINNYSTRLPLYNRLYFNINMGFIHDMVGAVFLYNKKLWVNLPFEALIVSNNLLYVSLLANYAKEILYRVFLCKFTILKCEARNEDVRFNIVNQNIRIVELLIYELLYTFVVCVVFNFYLCISVEKSQIGFSTNV